MFIAVDTTDSQPVSIYHPLISMKRCTRFLTVTLIMSVENQMRPIQNIYVRCRHCGNKCSHLAYTQRTTPNSRFCWFRLVRSVSRSVWCVEGCVCARQIKTTRVSRFDEVDRLIDFTLRGVSPVSRISSIRTGRGRHHRKQVPAVPHRHGLPYHYVVWHMYLSRFRDFPQFFSSCCFLISRCFYRRMSGRCRGGRG